MTSAIARTNDGHDIIPASPPTAPLQRVQTQFSTAIQVQRPRELAKVKQDAAIVGGLIGSGCFYAWGTGDARVEGITVKLANELARIWGNCAIDLAPVQETHDAWIFTASFVDLETGFTMSRQFRQSKRWQVHGRFDQDRKDDIRFQIGQSKALRNVILNCIPEYVTRAAVDAAKGNLRQKIEDSINRSGRDAVIAKMLQSLLRIGVDEKRLLENFGYAKTLALTVDDLVVVRSNLDAIEEGSANVDECFPPIAAPAGEGKSKVDRAIGALGGVGESVPASDAADSTSASDGSPAEQDADAGGAPDKPASGLNEEQRGFLNSLGDEAKTTNAERFAAAQKKAKGK